jgi:hypothetical protein
MRVTCTFDGNSLLSLPVLIFTLADVREYTLAAVVLAAGAGGVVLTCVFLEEFLSGFCTCASVFMIAVATSAEIRNDLFMLKSLIVSGWV